MKGFLEEYGTLMIACIVGMALIIYINILILDGGSYNQILVHFFKSVGIMQG